MEIYVDKYEQKLKTAIEKAGYLPSILHWKVPCFQYLGAAEGKHGKTHYYYDGTEDTYYSESDFAREMRLKIRRNQLQKYAKK